jgi:hypothetical protein
VNAVQFQALRALCDAIIETVGEAGTLGAPAGPMYAALMGQLSLHQFEQVMDGLVKAGKLRREGFVYFLQEPKQRAQVLPTTGAPPCLRQTS